MAMSLTVVTNISTKQLRSLRSRLLRLALLVVVGVAAFPQALLADAISSTVGKAADTCTFCNGIRLGDEISLVNTRSLCGVCDPEAIRKGLRFEEYAVCDEAGHRQWQPTDLESFVNIDPTVPTVIFVHGNQISPGDAKTQGLALYRKLVNYGGCRTRIRFIIFSWPASKIPGPLKDVRIKALRTGPAGCQLAWLLDQMPADASISLVGFSFGARVITAGLHVLGGGSVCNGMTLEDRVHPNRAPVNAVLVAAAVHAHWLGKGQAHGLAMTQVDRMFLINNCDDLLLNYYHLTTTDGSRPKALGICGPTYIDAEYSAKIRMRDVSRYAGSRHDLFLYLCAPGSTGQVWDYATTAPGLAVEKAAEPQFAK